MIIEWRVAVENLRAKGESKVFDIPRNNALAAEVLLSTALLHLLYRHFRSWLAFQVGSDQRGKKVNERTYIVAHAGSFKCGHIGIAFFYWNDGPRIATSGQHDIH